MGTFATGVLTWERIVADYTALSLNGSGILLLVPCPCKPLFVNFTLSPFTPGLLGTSWFQDDKSSQQKVEVSLGYASMFPSLFWNLQTVQLLNSFWNRNLQTSYQGVTEMIRDPLLTRLWKFWNAVLMNTELNLNPDIQGAPGLF